MSHPDYPKYVIGGLILIHFHNLREMDGWMSGWINGWIYKQDRYINRYRVEHIHTLYI